MIALFSFTLPRNFRHMQEYEEEKIELRAKGYAGRQIRKKFGFTIKQKNFVTGYNKMQDKLAAEITLKRKGRPLKDCVVSSRIRLPN